MNEQELIPHLFRTEYRKIVSVLCRLFGIEHIEVAEDIVSDTFLQASELWGLKGLPENPTAWLYTVSKNKTKDYLKRNALFNQKISSEITYVNGSIEEIEIDLSIKNIQDSQLAMMFAVCDSCISPEAQIGLSLNILCGFGVEEIASAFLTNKEVIYKRLNRSKEKLRTEKIKIEYPSKKEIHTKLENVLTTIYLLFNEGYYSSSKDTGMRKDLCFEAMRLNFLLIENETTNLPQVNALMSLMCFHASRFDARIDGDGEIILYEDQNSDLWNLDLIEKGVYFLTQASTGTVLSKYHIEAAIAHWHTQQKDSSEKWEEILQLYNKLLVLEYSPIAALNRTFALAKANGKEAAIVEAEKLNLIDNHLYHTLLGNLHMDVDPKKALEYFKKALNLAKSTADKNTIIKNISKLQKDG